MQLDEYTDKMMNYSSKQEELKNKFNNKKVDIC